MNRLPARGWRYLLPILAALCISLPLLLSASRFVSAAPSEDVESRINAIVDQMSSEELVGQTLMLGYNAMPTGNYSEEPGQGLQEIINEFKPGSIILFDDNLPTAKATDAAFRERVWRLTDSLQREAFDSQPNRRKVPLIIATDQEGGARVQVKKGITRTPDPMYIGATRSPDIAKAAGKIIASELKRLGINTDLAPVADINNNDKQDVVGKRSFGANKKLVAPLAVCYMKGLQEEGILSFAKHYPGHGDAGDDPHFRLPKVGYTAAAALQDWDLYPFRELVYFGVNGLMTAHLLARAIDIRPVTVSKKAADQLRQGQPPFTGIIVTDDIGEMMGILSEDAGYEGPGDKAGDEFNEHYNRQRSEVAKDALMAGTDIVMFARLYRIEYEAHPERSVTVAEFRDIYKRLLAEFQDGERKSLLKEKVKRILHQKSVLVPVGSFEDLGTWQPRFDEITFAQLQGNNAKLAKELPRKAVIQITNYGTSVNRAADSTLFGDGQGALSYGRLLKNTADTLLVISPVFKDDSLTRLIRNDPDLWLSRSNIRSERLIYGWKQAAVKDAERHWEQKESDFQGPVRIYQKQDSDGNINFLDDNIAERARELVAAAQGVKAVIFGVVVESDVKILMEFLKQVRATPVLVLLFKEPYFLPSSIYEDTNVSVLFGSPFPDEAAVVDALFGRLQPHPISYSPFNVPGQYDVSRMSIELEPAEDCDLARFGALYDEAHDEYGAAWSELRDGKRDSAKESAHRAFERLNNAYGRAGSAEELDKAEKLRTGIDRLLLRIEAQ